MQLLNLTLLFIHLFWQPVIKPNPVPRPRHKFTVVSHRGDHTVYPENTLNGYAMAIKNGADYIEIDLRTTKDGKLISMHDASVDRTTNGKGWVKDLTLDQIEGLIVKGRTTEDTLQYHVPLFEEILKLCKHKIYIYIDFKEADAPQTLAMLKHFGMEKQVLVYINKPSQFTDWRKTYPGMPLMVSLPNNVKDTVALKKFIDQYQPDILDGDYTDYTVDMVKYAQNLGLTVWPDGQSALEGPAVWDKAIALGFNGLQTDHPLAFVNYLKEKGLR
jgi:glycerophosphoryl diester phosphodiesterase